MDNTSEEIETILRLYYNSSMFFGPWYSDIAEAFNCDTKSYTEFLDIIHKIAKVMTRCIKDSKPENLSLLQT